MEYLNNLHPDYRSDTSLKDGEKEIAAIGEAKQGKFKGESKDLEAGLHKSEIFGAGALERQRAKFIITFLSIDNKTSFYITYQVSKFMYKFLNWLVLILI